ncbi:MAG: hypothetical protein E7473_07505 [Ruminococcaceae bacterium]|nr:hypothetical protein [Oscillospiraceae bacterium]MBQ7119868.1 M55 family metallopeptidase [Oscillospiraceae bacterium]
MKIAIMTDLEGVAGVVNQKDWIHPDSVYYEQGKILLTEEVNAAIRGFFDAGADEIVVIDGHGYGAINTLLLDKRALYSRGWGVPYQFGLNDNFDAIAWIGQHAKAGTMESHISHTGNFGVLEKRINGISIGEYGQYTMISGFYGVRTIFASGERALTKEVKSLTPWVHTVEVKYGVTRDNGANCTAEEYADHNLGAVHVHPEVARERIYKGAKEALLDFIANREKFEIFCPKPPYIQEMWLRKSENRPAQKWINRHDTDIVKMCSSEPEILAEGKYEAPYIFKTLDD